MSNDKEENRYLDEILKDISDTLNDPAKSGMFIYKYFDEYLPTVEIEREAYTN